MQISSRTHVDKRNHLNTTVSRCLNWRLRDRRTSHWNYWAGRKSFLHLRHHEILTGQHQTRTITSLSELIWWIIAVVPGWWAGWHGSVYWESSARYKAGTSYPVILGGCTAHGYLIQHGAWASLKVGNVTFSTSASARLHREGGALLMAYQDYINFSREALLEKWQRFLPEKRLTRCLVVESVQP